MTTCSTGPTSSAPRTRSATARCTAAGCASTPRSIRRCSCTPRPRTTSCPPNTLGVDSAMVSLDTQTGAIRAMVGGDGFEPGQSEVNMALSPRQTGSSIKFFILAAALQAGAKADDVLMGEEYVHDPESRQPARTAGDRRCRRPRTRHARRAHLELGELRLLAASPRSSVWTGWSTRSYRMAKSPYLIKGKDADDPLRNEALEPYASFATGGNEMSALDMASGAQSIANDGVHHEPVLRRAGRVGRRHGDLRALQRRHAGARPQGRPQDDRRAEARAHQSERNGSAVPARRRPTGGRQDRHTGQQHQRLVRRLHPAAHDRRVGGQSQRLRGDGRHPRVQPVRRRCRGAGWPDPGDVVEGVHGSGPRRAPDRGLGATAAAPPTRKPVRLFLPGMECAKRIVGYDHVVLGFANPAGFAGPVARIAQPGVTGNEPSARRPTAEPTRPDPADDRDEPGRPTTDDTRRPHRRPRTSRSTRTSRRRRSHLTSSTPTCRCRSLSDQRVTCRALLTDRADWADDDASRRHLLDLQRTDTRLDQLRHRRAHAPEHDAVAAAHGSPRGVGEAARRGAGTARRACSPTSIRGSDGRRAQRRAGSPRAAAPYRDRAAGRRRR